ncbi:prepilin peptidase [Helcococcus massiliensis]|uniref:prepilin peptidase n=1 Tax=Helcococcus massiliensis TaxID=2040290 RepID=UPI000CDE7285|nr:prepilin peptidase [Helcococcus massiliensis]
MFLTIIFKKYLDENFYISNKIFYFQLLISSLFYILYPAKDYFILSILLIISIIDIKEYIIPNFLVLLLIPIKILYINQSDLKLDFIPMIFLSFLFVLSMMDLGLGMGDVKLLSAIFIVKGGVFLIQLLLVLSIIIFLVGIYFLIMKKEKSYKFPLGPFILLSYLLI